MALSGLAAFQLFKLPPVLPAMLDLYGYDRTLAGGFMSVYALIGLLVSIPLGRWIEARGAHRPVRFGLVLFLFANLATLTIPDQGLLVLLARAAEGLAFGMLAIAGPALANSSASRRHLPLVIGATAAWIPFGQILASVIAPLALPFFGWQGLWYATLLATLAVLGWSLLRRDLLPGPGTKSAAKGGSPTSASSLTTDERRALLLAAGIFMIWSCQYFAAMTWLPQYLVEAFALPLDLALAGYLLPVAVLFVFCLITGLLLRIGIPLRVMIVAALLGQSLAWWLMPVAAERSLQEPWLGLLLLAAYGVTAGIAPTCLFAMPAAILGPGRSPAAAFGLIMTGRNIGVFAGPILVPLLLAWTGAWDVNAPLFGALLLVAVTFAVILSRRLRT